mgnify:CR=1
NKYYIKIIQDFFHITYHFKNKQIGFIKFGIKKKQIKKL